MMKFELKMAAMNVRMVQTLIMILQLMIMTYLHRLSEDHEKFNKHPAQWNKKIKDAEEQWQKEIELSKTNLIDTLSDLQKRFDKGVNVCNLLAGDFVASIALLEHKIKSEKYGKMSYKQDWST